MPAKPSVTIVVPAYNEEFGLSATLEALRKQDYDGAFEIVVVNNNSTDRTAEIARGLGCRVVDETTRGYVHAIRRGFGDAQGDVIACTDADTIVPSNWISRIVANLSRPGVVACSGPILFADGSWLLKILAAVVGRMNWHLAGANMGVWKCAFVKAGGFRTDINMGADVELGFRLQKVGTLLIDGHLPVRTSARRFQLAFFRTLVRYYVNDLCLVVLRRPLFYGFPNYRLTSSSATSMALRLAMPFMFLMAFAWVAENPIHRFLGTVLASGGNAPIVALTFDDGPGASTQPILDILRQHRVRATFFVIGKNAERHPDLLRRIASAGHAVGSHTYSHPFWSTIETPRQVGRELEKTEDVLSSIIGERPVFFRPPHGWRTPWMMKECAQRGYTVVTWNVDSRDWQHLPASVVRAHVVAKARGGAIILMHDGLNIGGHPDMTNTVAALPGIIEDLQKEGYRFVTIPELYDLEKNAEDYVWAASASDDTPNPADAVIP